MKKSQITPNPRGQTSGHRALDLDDPALSAEDAVLFEQRLAEHRRNPESAVAMDAIKKARLRGRCAP